MIPKEAIEKAIEGGWKVPYWGTNNICREYVFALDPAFWQTLGKALPTKFSNPNGSGYVGAKGRVLGWKDHAMHFYDLILTGGDTKPFWDELLKV